MRKRTQAILSRVRERAVWEEELCVTDSASRLGRLSLSIIMW